MTRPRRTLEELSAESIEEFRYVVMLERLKSVLEEEEPVVPQARFRLTDEYKLHLIIYSRPSR